MEKEIKPVYKFVEEEGNTELAPVRRKLSKTMEVTETFTMWDALTYMAKLDKAIADKKAEIDGLINMKEAYEKEVAVIKDELNLNELEAEFAKEVKKDEESKDL